jgi:hypothetical protein
LNAAVALLAGIAAGLREPRSPSALGLGADRRRPAGGAGDGSGVEVAVKVALAEVTGLGHAGRQRRQHLDLAGGELGADRAGPIGGVAEYPRGRRSGS